MKQKFKWFSITALLIIIYSIPLHAADLKWEASTGDVSGYTIYYGLSHGSYTFSDDVGNVTQYSLDNFSLSEGTTYYFVVRAYNAFGESGDSNVTTYAVPSADDTTPPIPPEGISGTIENEDILLTWEVNSETDISGYRVYYGTSNRDYGLPIPVDGTEYSIAGLVTDVTYYFAVTAVDTSGNESGFSEEIELTNIIEDAPPTSVSLTSDLSSPQPEGIQVTFTAEAVGGSGNYEYRFFTRNSEDGTWHIVQDYSSSQDFIWNVTDNIDYIAVWSRNAGSNASWQVNKAILFSSDAVAPPPTSVSLTSDLSSPQPEGIQVTFTAEAVGGSGNYEYRFFTKNNEDGTWHIVQDYSSSQDFIWNVTDNIDYIAVWSRNAGSNASWQVNKTILFSSDTNPPTSVSLTSDLSSPQSEGTQVAFTAEAVGGSGSYEYKFWVRHSEDKTWHIVQDYSSSQDFIWNATDNIDAIGVWSRNAETNASWQVTKSIPFNTEQHQR
jgi:hypothetical protein